MNVSRTALRGVTYYDPPKAHHGYTLFSTSSSELGEFLIDMEGHIVNRWKTQYTQALHGTLLPNGNLMYAGVLKSPEETREDMQARLGFVPVDFVTGISIGGIIQELDWDGNLVWELESKYQTHDFLPLPNGHIIISTIVEPESVAPQELLAKWKGGLPGSEFDDRWPGAKPGDKVCYGDALIEYDRDGKVIWRWNPWEHLDPEIDVFCPLSSRSHLHSNAMWLCKNGDILYSLRHMSMVHRIEYPSGRVVKRYGVGEILHQHDCRELENGNVLVFDNGPHRHTMEPPYSRSVEFDGQTTEIVWQHKANPPNQFYSAMCAGSERLPNGNTLICEAYPGRFLEVTREGELVWEYKNPLVAAIPGFMRTTMAFRAHRYDPSYPGLKGKNLDPDRFPWENLFYGSEAFPKEFHPCLF